MFRSKVKESIILGLLTIILMFLIFEAGQSIYDYYRGPIYIVDRYVEALENKNYEMAFSLLEETSTQKVGSKADIIEYYKYVYDTESCLESIEKVGVNGESYILQYNYTDFSQTNQLQLVHEDRHWRIRFPFTSYEVTVKAPYGSTVLIGNEVIQAENEIFYKKSVLPGDYNVQVIFSNENYEPYHQSIRVPDVLEIDMPYALCDASIRGVKGLEMQLDGRRLINEKGSVDFTNLLEGTYLLEVEDDYGYLEPVEALITLDEGSNLFEVHDMLLSDKGKNKLGIFLSRFYEDYLEDIKLHSYKASRAYFSEVVQEAQGNLFIEWFVNNKDIQDADIFLGLEGIEITSEGYIKTTLEETIELTNNEDNELSEGKEKQVYRVFLRWETIINMHSLEWEIVNRTLVESIVAYKDSLDRWVQY